VEVMTLTGPVRYSVLVVVDLKTRHVEVAGIVLEAYEQWMIQVLRNVTDAVACSTTTTEKPHEFAPIQ
jgi:hypothetical protein